jgi:putative SOS response-associated peptidase YedK
MCGRIVQNKRIIRPGNSLFVYINKNKVPLIWGTEEGYYNARIENWHTVWEPKNWKLCKVPIEGFYEGHGEKNTLFSGNIQVRGLYKGNRVVIMTKDSNDLIKSVHHRMPVILENE